MTSNRTRRVLGMAGVLALIVTVTTVTEQQRIPKGPAEADVSVVSEAILASPQVDAGVSAAVATGACADDDAFELSAWHMSRAVWNWWYNPADAPASPVNAVGSIWVGKNAVFTGTTWCGYSVSVPITHFYRGSTSAQPQISATGACTGNDQVSVIGWGNLSANVLGYTCTYYRTSSGVVVSSDTVLSSQHKWFVGPVPANCINQFDLQSVVVHETGHSIGLNHVDQAAHGLQVMSPRTSACTVYKRRLWAGDAAGLIAAVG